MNHRTVRFCPRGHDTLECGRLENNRDCKECHRERGLAQRQQRRLSANGEKGKIVYRGRNQFCPNGHDTWVHGRYACSSVCRVCALERSVRQREQDPGRVRGYKRRWHFSHPDIVRASSLNWRKKNRLYDSLRGSSRRALLRSVGLKEGDFNWVVDYYGPSCVYCGAPMSGFDHLHPLSRGGEHVLLNLAPSCFSCNSGKRDRPIWYMIRPVAEFRVRPSSRLVPGR